MRRRAFSLVALLVLAAPGSALAKGATVRLVLTCGGLAAPVVIADSARLTFALGPWGGGFMDTTRSVRTAPTRPLRPCEVAFYVRYGPSDVQLAYVVYYYPRSRGRSGYVYLPGRGNPWYALNAGTILRRGRDGHWMYASRAWEEGLIRPALAEATGGARSGRGR
jgi:hypothetical protein